MEDLKKAIEELNMKDAIALLDHWWDTKPETLSHWWAIKIEEDHASKA
jgi:hypothetical protein